MNRFIKSDTRPTQHLADPGQDLFGQFDVAQDVDEVIGGKFTMFATTIDQLIPLSGIDALKRNPDRCRVLSHRPQLPPQSVVSI